MGDKFVFDEIRLGDLYPITSGGTPSKRHIEYYEGGNIPWVKTGDLKCKKLKSTEDYITEAGFNNSSARMYKKNTVLLAMYGATIGATSILDIDACTNQACAAFEENESVLPEYLYYFLQSRKSTFVRDGIGGAQPNISAGYLKQVIFLKRSIESQKEIIKILGKVEQLQGEREKQLDELDTLIKARFIEMFGDPVYNERGWPQVTLKETTSKIGSGATPRGGKESYCEEGICLIRSMNVHGGRFEYKDLAHLSNNQAAQLDNVIVEENDVFINITGASVARSCIVPSNVLPARVNQHVAIIRCNRSWLHPVFANNMFLNDRFKERLLNMGESGGATRQAITKQQLESLVVILPPIELQEQFAAFVQQVDKSKSAIKKSLNELQILFDSLMQEYFG